MVVGNINTGEWVITLIMAHPDNFIVLTRIDVFTQKLVPLLWIL